MLGGKSSPDRAQRTAHQPTEAKNNALAHNANIVFDARLTPKVCQQTHGQGETAFVQRVD